MEDQESTTTDADKLLSVVKTEEGMTAIVIGDKEVSRRNLRLSKLRKSLLG